MVSRLESAAGTRRALLDAAAQLLDEGGPETVTLREVGARAGVSRGAPYRHFADKDSLLTAVAAGAWERVGDAVQALRDDPGLPATDKLRSALSTLIAVGREQPHLFRMMFTNPAGDPSALLGAAQRSQDEFLAIVAELVGEQDARRYGALLMTSAHGITGMVISGHLTAEKWQTSAEELVEMIVGMVETAGSAVTDAGR